MSGKNQGPITLNWQSTNPQTGFDPVRQPHGTNPSGVVSGAMASTNVIYTNIIDVSRMDNLGYEIAWTGTPNGTVLVLVSNSGLNWSQLTIAGFVQPVGSANNFALSLNQVPFRYLMFQYTNSSGSGTLAIYGQQKDLN